MHKFQCYFDDKMNLCLVMMHFKIDMGRVT